MLSPESYPGYPFPFKMLYFVVVVVVLHSWIFFSARELI